MHVPTKQMWLPLVASLSLAVVGMGCGDDPKDAPDATPEVVDTTAIIGAEGGVLEVTNVDSSLLGLRVEVPAGAFSADTEITISPRDSSDSSAALEPGLVALGLGFDLVSETPFAEDVLIAFPLRAPVEEEGQLLSAFYLDDASSAWTAEFPGAVDAGEFSIATRRLGAWRWGVMLLADVESESLISPLLSTYGNEAIEAIKKGAQDFIDAQLGELDSFLTWNNCGALNAVFDAVTLRRDEAKLAVAANQNSSCGPCDVGVDVVIEDIGSLVKAKFIEVFGGALVDNIDFGGPGISGFILGIVLEGVAKAAVAAASEPQLNCDYTCYYDENPELYWETVGAYYGAEATLVALLAGAIIAECTIVIE